MSVANLYALSIKSALQGKMNVTSDALKCALLTSAYTPALGTHQFFSDVNANEASGTGYTAGGQLLTSVTLVTTLANSWGTSAATSTVYAAGAVVRPSTGNGFLYQAVVGGTSGGSAPTWPTTFGQTVVDGGVTWVNIGESVTILSAANPSWASSTISARYAAFYDSTPGTAATDPLISLVDFGSTLSSSGAAFTVALTSLGFAMYSLA